MSKKKQEYRIIYAGYMLEGPANNPQHAARLAIRTLLKQKVIKSPPESRDGWWKGLQCQILDENGLPKPIKVVGTH